MKLFNLITLAIMSAVLVGCAALEHYDRSPAAKAAHKNYVKKRTDHNFHFGFDRVDRSGDLN